MCSGSGGPCLEEPREDNGEANVMKRDEANVMKRDELDIMKQV